MARIRCVYATFHTQLRHHLGLLDRLRFLDLQFKLCMANTGDLTMLLSDSHAAYHRRRT